MWLVVRCNFDLVDPLALHPPGLLQLATTTPGSSGTNQQSYTVRLQIGGGQLMYTGLAADQLSTPWLGLSTTTAPTTHLQGAQRLGLKQVERELQSRFRPRSISRARLLKAVWTDDLMREPWLGMWFISGFGSGNHGRQLLYGMGFGC